MAKKTQNEIVLLAVGCVCLIAAVAVAVLTVKGIESDFFSKKSQRQELQVLEGEVLIENSLRNLERPKSWSVTQSDGRDLRLFTSVPLFTKPGERDPIDLFESTGQDVHKGMPNSWWLKYDLDPSYVNSPEQDPDGDGFSNREEFAAKTNPNEFSSHPDLGAKLALESSSVLKWKLLFSSEIGENQYQFKYQNTKGQKLRTDYIASGDSFFSAASVQNRFVLNDVVTESQETRGVSTDVKFALISDTQKGKKIKIPRASRNDFLGQDYTLVVSLKAVGKESETFTILENQRFDLPSLTVSKEGKYHFESVINASEAIITWQEGEKKRRIVLPIR